MSDKYVQKTKASVSTLTIVGAITIVVLVGMLLRAFFVWNQNDLERTRESPNPAGMRD